MRVAMHWHPGLRGVMKATTDILAVIHGIEIVDTGQPAVGLMSNYMNAMPEYKKRLQRQELDAARDAGVDALVAVYHADHRDLCAHERDYPFEIINVLELVGAAMGLQRPDTFKPLKIMQDVDLIVAECGDLIAQHGISDDNARKAVKAMIEEQPLPLMGKVKPAEKAARPADG
jgi:heterodisulfide reductase subunit D